MFTTRRHILTATTAVVLATGMVACGSDDGDDAAQSTATPADDSSQATEHTYTVADEIAVTDAGKVRGLEVGPDGRLTAYVSSVEADVPGQVVSVDTSTGDATEIAELPMDELIMRHIFQGFDDEQLALASLKAPLTHIVDEDGNRTDELRVVDGNGVGVEVDDAGDAQMVSDRALSGLNSPNSANRGIFGAADMNGYVAVSQGSSIRFGMDGAPPEEGEPLDLPVEHTRTSAVLDGEDLMVTELDAAGEDTVIAVVYDEEGDAEPQLVQIDLSVDSESGGDTVTDTFTVEGLPDGAQITGVALDPEDENAAWLAVDGQGKLYRVELS